MLGAVTLAGCTADSSGDAADERAALTPDRDLGERVDTLVMEYWSDYGGHTTTQENMAPVIRDSVESALGVEISIQPVDFTAQVGNVYHDERTHELTFWWHSNAPDRLDPHETTRRFAGDWAGGDGNSNPQNYINCEFTELAVGQANARSEEERREMVANAHSIMSEDRMTIPLAPNVVHGAYRTDAVEIGGVGEAGLTRTNPNVFIKSRALEDEYITAATGPVPLETRNFPISDSTAGLAIWNRLVHSPLVAYDEDYELVNVLAESYEVEADGTIFTVELRDGTFHNGDPITAEDVAFTFSHLAENAGIYSKATAVPYESITTIDDRTVEFVTEQPHLPLVTGVWPRWGVFHKETWVDGGVRDNPEEFDFDPIVGSGPFVVEDYQQGSHLELTPHEGHPFHEPESSIYWRVYQDQQSEYRAFSQNEVQIICEQAPGVMSEIERELTDTAETNVAQGFMYFSLYPQFPVAPTKFYEFRAALGKAIDRERLIETAFVEPVDAPLYSCPLAEAHPFRPPDEQLTKLVDDPRGEVDAARQVLIDAGWGWDEDGRLHYPDGTDLSPRWPEGEVPDPDEYDCL
ncbi:hypothetical protein GCM10025298_25610 [Natronobiforma cellulositropha]